MKGGNRILGITLDLTLDYSSVPDFHVGLRRLNHGSATKQQFMRRPHGRNCAAGREKLRRVLPVPRRDDDATALPTRYLVRPESLLLFA